MMMRVLAVSALVMSGVVASASAQNYDPAAEQELQQSVQQETYQQSAQVAKGTESVQNLIANVQNVQKCMKEQDPNGFAKMNAQGYAVQQEVARLCKLGNRDKAQEMSLQFAADFKQSASYQTMSKCAPPAYMQMAEGMMAMATPQGGGAGEAVNVCDHIQDVQSQNH